jgi:tetratricopeptide (TPR) repeat protein
MKKHFVTIIRQAFQIGFAVTLLCSFLSAQKSKKPLSAENYYERGVAKANIDKCEEAIKDFNNAIRLDPRDA